jgi:hypothetical protein
MKSLAFIAVVFCLAIKCFGSGEVLWPSAYNYAYTNTTFSLSITNSSATNNQGTIKSVQHTFQNYYTATGTNTCTNSFDATADPSLSQWVNHTSFVYTATGSNEFQANGKWVAWRVRTTMLGTNGSNTNTVFYVGQ